MDGGDQWSITSDSGLAALRAGCIRGRSLLTCTVLVRFPSEMVYVIGPFTVCTS